jgi:DNA-binding GntR family transcriptional regulator
MADEASPHLPLKLTPVIGKSRQTAHEVVRETLRQAILLGELKPGTRLVQAEVAEQLAVSTTPVREALRDLAAEGLIELDAHRGGTVLSLTVEEMEEIYDIRLILEVEAMRRAVDRLTPEQIDRAEAIHTEMMESAPQSQKWVTMNRDFHMTIYAAADSPRLIEMVRSLIDSSMVYLSATWQTLPDLRERAGHDHGEIIEALRARDTDAAVEHIRRHLSIPRSVLQLDH